MLRSSNGWTASPTLALRPLVIDGIGFLPGIRDDDDVETVLRYVLTAYHERVEPLTNPGCWGYSYRPNRNSPGVISNHGSGTAVDANAPRHPNGVPTARTFTPAQIAEVHQILAEVDGAVRWGGDYSGTPDAMHFEIDVSPTALAVVAERVRTAVLSEDRAREIAREEIANYKVDVGGTSKIKLPALLVRLWERTKK